MMKLLEVEGVGHVSQCPIAVDTNVQGHSHLSTKSARFLTDAQTSVPSPSSSAATFLSGFLGGIGGFMAGLGLLVGGCGCAGGLVGSAGRGPAAPAGLLVAASELSVDLSHTQRVI